MTLKELEAEVLALCFESSIEDSSAFIGATRRALSQIATERDRSELFSAYIPKDAPSEESHRLIDVGERDKRFLAFRTPPKKNQTEAIVGAFTYLDKVFIPKDYSGYVFIEYKRQADLISFATTDAELDVAKECEHLLGLLVASYLLLDGNETLADYYMSLYREGMAAVKIYNRPSQNTDYIDTTGWA